MSKANFVSDMLHVPYLAPPYGSPPKLGARSHFFLRSVWAVTAFLAFSPASEASTGTTPPAQPAETMPARGQPSSFHRIKRPVVRKNAAASGQKVIASPAHGGLESKTSTGAANARAVQDDEVIEEADVVVKSAADHAEWWSDAYSNWDRIIDAYTARTIRKRSFQTLFTHRNNAGALQNSFHTLFGFDQGLLKVGLGLRYGILDYLDVGILRMNGTVEVFDTYEFDARLQFLTQDKFGIDAAIRPGLSWFSQPPGAPDALGGYVQLLVSRLVLDRAFVGGGFLYHSDSSGPKKSNLDSASSFAVQAYVDLRITQGLAWAFELTEPIAGYHLSNPDFTTGPRFITNRHTFSIVWSNTQYTNADGIVTGSDRFGLTTWVLGFNITREL